MLPITLSMVVHNAELNLRHCLNRCTWLFNEIVIVDSGSTDRTIQIAKEFTNNVYPMPFCNFCEPYRQLSIELATQPWVFILDDDECPDDALITAMPTYIEQPHDVIRFHRRSFLQGKFAMEDPDQGRLLKKSSSLYWPNRIHNRVTGERSTSGIQPVGQILHYHSSVASIEEKRIRYDGIYMKWYKYWDQLTTEFPPFYQGLINQGYHIKNEFPRHTIDPQIKVKRF